MTRIFCPGCEHMIKVDDKRLPPKSADLPPGYAILLCGHCAHKLYVEPDADPTSWGVIDLTSYTVPASRGGRAAIPSAEAVRGTIKVEAYRRLKELRLDTPDAEEKALEEISEDPVGFLNRNAPVRGVTGEAAFLAWETL